jgi:hypothetical protein
MTRKKFAQSLEVLQCLPSGLPRYSFPGSIRPSLHALIVWTKATVLMSHVCYGVQVLRAYQAQIEGMEEQLRSARAAADAAPTQQPPERTLRPVRVALQ